MALIKETTNHPEKYKKSNYKSNRKIYKNRLLYGSYLILTSHITIKPSMPVEQTVVSFLSEEAFDNCLKKIWAQQFPNYKKTNTYVMVFWCVVSRKTSTFSEAARVSKSLNFFKALQTTTVTSRLTKHPLKISRAYGKCVSLASRRSILRGLVRSGVQQKTLFWR